jgi:osmotically-inducible protein OsmY
MAERWGYRDDRGYRERGRYERPVTDRAGDEVRSWFGDEEAARRRHMDEIREDRLDRDWSDRAARTSERAWDRTRDAARDFTDRDRDGRRGLAEFADNDRASYYSGYSRPSYRDDYWTRDGALGWQAANYAGRGPRGYQRSDERIREDVCDRLTDDPRIDASDIEVHMQGGELTLSGSVRTRDEKHFTEDLVERITGVREVNNHLRVRPATDVLGTARSGASVLGITDTPPPPTQRRNH